MNAVVTDRAASGSIPASAGIGLRTAHQREVLATLPAVGWLEVHSENYFAPGSPAHAPLTRLRRDYPLSLHGVGLSLGSTDPLDRAHLARLKELVDRYEPALVSEHLSFSSVDGRFANDLLPLPCTREALELLVLRVDQTQDCLGRPILLENISSYLRFRGDMPEACFVSVLDVNNLYVNECNHGDSAAAFIDALPLAAVGEIHLAGHSVHDYDGRKIVVDTHSARVAPAVWALYRRAVARFGRVPTLIEWDSELPALSVLLDEAARADAILGGDCALAA